MFETDKTKITNGNLLTLDTEEGKKYINMEQPAAPPSNAIEMELTAFADSILNDTQPLVGIEAGYQTLRVAHQIIERIEERGAMVGSFL